jgi:hypothetical protein
MKNMAGEVQAPLVGDGLAALAIGLAGVSVVVIFLPAEGFIAAPLHSTFEALLGRTAFIVPAFLLLVGCIRLLRVPLPIGQLLGMSMLLVSVLAAEQLLRAGDAGAAGQWAADALTAALGAVGATVVLVCALGIGAWLTFGIRLGPK